MPLSGREAALNITSATATSSTGVAATRSTGPGSETGFVQINSTAQRVLDPDSTPTLYLNSTAVSSTAFTVNPVQGKFEWVIGDPPTGTYTADIEYLTLAKVAGGRQWTLNVDQDMFDITEFGSSGWKQYLPNMAGGQGSISRFWNDPTFFDYINTDQKFLIDLVVNSGEENRYQAFAYVTSDQIATAVDSLVNESVNYTAHGRIYYTTN
jgi:predicted secreted protein